MSPARRVSSLVLAVACASAVWMLPACGDRRPSRVGNSSLAAGGDSSNDSGEAGSDAAGGSGGSNSAGGTRGGGGFGGSDGGVGSSPGSGGTAESADSTGSASGGAQNGSGGSEPAGGSSGSSGGGTGGTAPTTGTGGTSTSSGGTGGVPLDTKACEEADAHAIDCGLLVTGSLCRVVPADVDVCLAACLRDAECADLEQVRCAFDPSDPMSGKFEDPDESFEPAAAQLAHCMNACAFTCVGENGKDVVLPTAYRCDEIADCPDESDEARCARNPFECDSGEIIVGSWVCDGEYDCPDAEDEANCDDEATVELSCE